MFDHGSLEATLDKSFISLLGDFRRPWKKPRYLDSTWFLSVTFFFANYNSTNLVNIILEMSCTSFIQSFQDLKNCSFEVDDKALIHKHDSKRHQNGRPWLLLGPGQKKAKESIHMVSTLFCSCYSPWFLAGVGCGRGAQQFLPKEIIAIHF